MDFAALRAVIDAAAPEETSFSWDKDGTDVCFDRTAEITKVLVCLDVTLNAIEYARSGGFNCIAVHHPLYFEPLANLDTGRTPAAYKTHLLARYGIGVISAHTRLDSAAGGVNDCFLRLIGVDPAKATPFGNAENGAAGRLFAPSESGIPDKPEELASLIKAKLEGYYAGQGYPLSVSAGYTCRGQRIKRAALVCGSGTMFFRDALEAGADAFITGEAKYEKIIEMSEAFTGSGTPPAILTCGHYESESPVLPHLCGLIKSAGFEASVYYDFALNYV